MTIKQRIAGAVLAISFAAGILSPIATMAINAPSGSGDYSTYSVSQLEALISKLQKQLEEMKKGSLCFVSDKDLSIGDGEGDDGLASEVKRLQEFLREKGVFAYKSTGYFGKMTRASVVAYQKSVGIAQSGEFDAATRAKAHASYCKNLKKNPSVEKKAEQKAEQKKEQPKASTVQSITLSADGSSGVKWTAVGHSPEGFKVVWSKNSGATYPPREGDNAAYYGESSSWHAGVHAFSGSGTYYVRVCEYIGGSAGICSNEIQLSLQE